jgi:hypothetical protein
MISTTDEWHGYSDFICRLKEFPGMVKEDAYYVRSTSNLNPSLSVTALSNEQRIQIMLGANSVGRDIIYFFDPYKDREKDKDPERNTQDRLLALEYLEHCLKNNEFSHSSFFTKALIRQMNFLFISSDRCGIELDSNQKKISIEVTEDLSLQDLLSFADRFKDQYTFDLKFYGASRYLAEPSTRTYVNYIQKPKIEGQNVGIQAQENNRRISKNTVSKKLTRTLFRDLREKFKNTLGILG